MSEASSSGVALRWGQLPRWARIGAIALLVGVLLVVGLVVFRILSGARVISYGPTEVGAIPAGACLAEDEADLEQYTVVDCAQAHPQQVFAIADLDVDDQLAAQLAGAIGAFADEVCQRHVEYRLGLVSDLEPRDYVGVAIGVPTAEAFESGQTEVRCALRADDGSPLTGDRYRPMP